MRTKCIIENIRVDDPSLANKIEQQKNVFRSSYLADSTLHHIADDAWYVKKLKIQVDKIIEKRKKI